jgi:hypothetical protein
MGSHEDAHAALDSALKTWKSLGNKSEHSANYLIARNVTDEEMGRYGEHKIEYSLSQKTKDTLLSHIAHALCNTKSILDQNERICAQSICAKVPAVAARSGVCTTF